MNNSWTLVKKQERAEHWFHRNATILKSIQKELREFFSMYGKIVFSWHEVYINGHQLKYLFNHCSRSLGEARKLIAPINPIHTCLLRTPMQMLSIHSISFASSLENSSSNLVSIWSEGIFALLLSIRFDTHNRRSVVFCQPCHHQSCSELVRNNCSPKPLNLCTHDTILFKWSSMDLLSSSFMVTSSLNKATWRGEPWSSYVFPKQSHFHFQYVWSTNITTLSRALLSISRSLSWLFQPIYASQPFWF